MSQLLRGCSHVIDESLDEFLVRHDPDYQPGDLQDEERRDFSSSSSSFSGLREDEDYYRSDEEEQERRGRGRDGEEDVLHQKNSVHSSSFASRRGEEDPQKRSCFGDTSASSSSAFPAECSLLHDKRGDAGGGTGGSCLKKGASTYTTSTTASQMNRKKRVEGGVYNHHQHQQHSKSLKSFDEVPNKIVNTQKLQRALSVAVTGLGEQVKQGGEMLWRTAVTAAGQVIVQHGLHHRSVGGVGFPSSPTSSLLSSSSSSFASAVSSASCFNLPHIAAAAISSGSSLAAGGLSLIGLDPHAAAGALGGGGESTCLAQRSSFLGA